MAKIGFRIWILIICLVLAILAISPSFKSGVVIKSISQNSTGYREGLRAGMIITQTNDQQIKTTEDYSSAISKLFTIRNLTRLKILADDQEFIMLTDTPPDMTVSNIPRTRIKTGLDLSGGARALIKPENATLTSSEINDLIAVTNERLNVYGLTDITIRPVQDLDGNNFMLIEIAGASPADLTKLLAGQGKFEAKIENETVFLGGERDITSVCRTDARCSRVYDCIQVSQESWRCSFEFSISLSPNAANHYSEVTKDIPVNISDPEFLDKKLDFFIDNVLVESLNINKDLKGSSDPNHAIMGAEFGATRDEAINNALEEMKRIQTVLITGSLPYKLEIANLVTISPKLGNQFIKHILIAGAVSMLIVAVIVFIRYRKIRSSLAVLLTSFSEILLILGIAALIKNNLDLAGIAGILITIGTGVDQQIIMLDEAHSGKQLTMLEKIKRALFIIMGAYFTALASLLPLYWAGAGLLKGFAVTTIIGVTVGVLITRPAFAEILKKIEK